MLSGCLHSCHDPPLLLMNARHSDHDYHNSKLSPNSEVGADSVNMGALNQTCKRWLAMLSNDQWRVNINVDYCGQAA